MLHTNLNKGKPGHLRKCITHVMQRWYSPIFVLSKPTLRCFTSVLPEQCRCHCNLCHTDQECQLQVPSASTLCVVNLTATEAKVEVLTSDFLQLRPATAQGGAGDEDAQDDCFMYDDDDNYQYEVSHMHLHDVFLMQSACLACN